MFGKAIKGTLGVGVGCLVLIIALMVIGGALSGAGKPSSSLTPALPNVTSSPPANSGTKTWAVVKSWSGSGIKDTEQFTVGAEWRIDWDYSPGPSGGLIQIFLYDSGNQLVGITANTQKAGADSSFQHKAGSYYLKINATGDWKVAVQDMR